MTALRIAVLDDYQEVALESADWSTLPAGSELQVFHDHLHEEAALVARLRGFQVIVAMRERTAFQRSLLAYVINTSRGPIIDETALVAALREQRIAGAGLDVFDQEPLPGSHPLRGLPNTVITPHIGYVTRETYRIFYRDVVEDIRAFAQGSPQRVLDA